MKSNVENNTLIEFVNRIQLLIQSDMKPTATELHLQSSMATTSILTPIVCTSQCPTYTILTLERLRIPTKTGELHLCTFGCLTYKCCYLCCCYY